MDGHHDLYFAKRCYFFSEWENVLEHFPNLCATIIFRTLDSTVDFSIHGEYKVQCVGFGSNARGREQTIGRRGIVQKRWLADENYIGFFVR